MIYPRVKTAGVYVNLLEGKIFFPKSMVVKMVEQDGEIWRDIWMCLKMEDSSFNIFNLWAFHSDQSVDLVRQTYVGLAGKWVNLNPPTLR